MAQKGCVPNIPIHCIPYEALHELAEVFDSPSVDGQRTLEGLAEAIFKLSDYRIRFNHNTIMVSISGHLNVLDKVSFEKFRHEFMNELYRKSCSQSGLGVILEIVQQ